ncbi:MAG: type II toxin-antitoxin system prevent-host-death family antitoxin [Actinomycetota bacterium]|jgi:prevent-host-death family protein|nr:type II toxin-antitoxin system prevent-host-death family antitoxin [Actinomycetota bacterium]
MTVVTVEEAKNHLPDVLSEVAKGEEVVIEGEGGEVFRLVRSEKPPKKKRGFVGSGKGWFVMSDDFDEPLEDFEGG